MAQRVARRASRRLLHDASKKNGAFDGPMSEEGIPETRNPLLDGQEKPVLLFVGNNPSNFAGVEQQTESFCSHPR